MLQHVRLIALSAMLTLPLTALAADQTPAAPATTTAQASTTVSVAPTAPASQPATATAPVAVAPATPAQAASAASDQAAAAAAPTAPAQPATMVANGKLPGPPPGKGQVVFYRSSFMGALISFMVREGTTELGKLSSRSYFVATLDPGPHDFAVHTENQDTLHMEIEAGETYYVSGSISMGLFVGHAHIAPSDEASFVQDFDKLKLNK